MAIPNLVAAELGRIERCREQEAEIDRPMCARVGDLAIGRCPPYYDMYRVCHVTRVDGEGYPTHLKDGAGIRYGANAWEKRGVGIMPETALIVPRECLSAPAREIAAEHRESHFCGTLQGVVDRAVGPYFEKEARTDPARYAPWMWAREARVQELRGYRAWAEAA